MRVDAFLSRPEDARSGAGGLWLLVNGRPVRDRVLSVTVAQAYGSVLERGRYPRGVVYVDLPLPLVDVNVHPQKAEVRFADPRTVSDALYSILSKALTAAFSLPPAHRGSWGRASGAPVQPAPAPDQAQPALAQAPAQAPSSSPPPGDMRTVGLASDPTASTESTTRTIATAEPIAVRDSAAARVQPSDEVLWSSLRFIAQLRQTYVLCEGIEGIYLLDQHAAA
jgi:DNA mismatch repair protein MutL